MALRSRTRLGFPCLLIFIIYLGNIQSETKADDWDNLDASREIVRAKRFIHVHGNKDVEDNNPFREKITARQWPDLAPGLWGRPGKPSIHDNTNTGDCVRPGGPCFQDLRCCTEKCQWVSFLFKCVYTRPGDTHVGGK